MANFNKYNFSNNFRIWNILFRKIIFRSLMNKNLYAQMAKQLDATSLSLFHYGEYQCKSDFGYH